MKKLLALVVALVLVMSMATIASAAEYPTKGISVICPWAAGGGTDAVLRAFCEAMGKDLGVTLTVDNRTGGGGVIGHQAIANADNDGYTIGMVTFELSTFSHLGTSPITYADYTPLCLVHTDAAGITVNTEWAKANNITDVPSFIEYCKAHPGEVQMGASANAGVWHIAGGYMMDAADIEIQMIPYQEGAATAVQNAASGFIQGVTVSLGEARAFIESGHLTLLGVMDTQRNSLFPDVATCQEQGFDVVYGTWRGMAVPKDTDPAIVARLEEAAAKAVEDEAFKTFMNNGGYTIAYLPSAEFVPYLENSLNAVGAAMESLGL